MAGEKGFLYEIAVSKQLKKFKLSPPGFQPAGSDSNAPDAIFLHKNNKFKLEIKLNLAADYGQGSLHYDLKTRKWELAGADTESGEEMKHLLKLLGVEKFVNHTWGKHGAPRKYLIDSKHFTRKDVDHDYKLFKEAFLHVPISTLFNYYGTKHTYYIQIGEGFGFYRMASDPAHLNVPKFDIGLKLRIRIKRGRTFPLSNYRFTTALQIARKPHPSAFNIDKSPEFLNR